MREAFILLVLLPVGLLRAQEASSGIDLRATVTAESIYSKQLTANPRDGTPIDAAFRAVLYPTWKTGEHWTVSGAIQINSNPYFGGDFTTPGHGVTTRILQASVGYARAWKQGSVSVRAGELSSAFGAFLLRYDDAENPLTGLPPGYGYYAPVTLQGLAGAQVDATLGRWDGRAQFVNSSPANPRSLLDKDQYGNWAGGIGLTLRQGFRVGASFYRGPYLDRHYPYFFPGESNPRDLPAMARGIDVEWAGGHWNVYGELQQFDLDYHAIPPFRQRIGYFEVKRVLHPRWYIAARSGYVRTSVHSGGDTYEAAAAFRPNAHQVIKVGYTVETYTRSSDLDRSFVVQVVTMIHPLSRAWK